MFCERHLFCRLSSSAMVSRVDVVLSWAIGGDEVQRWYDVSITSFLGDVVSEELLNSLPGEVEVIRGPDKLRRPLIIELWECMESEEDCLSIGLVRTQAYKDDECDLIPYLSTDGATAVKIPDLGVRFTFPKGQKERFSHAFAAMTKEFGGKSETHIERQVLHLMGRELPGCVLRRKIGRFFSDVNGEDSPLAIRCVLVINASGGLLLRMDTCWFAMVEDAVTAAEVKTAVNSIYNASF